ncbi:NAD(P)-dependent oxidoreductase [Burkholderiaceae bacterium FT117]|nr:NAD(P)-dependent oxidoreductase [Zeimonas sediminis]MCM5571424.1 NAD(P)-dependent oxidoreductase [Zeimonas sediminis]
MSDTIAFIGLGAMGAPMAANLLDAGFAVRAFNRNPDKAKPLAEKGATVCGSIAEAVKGASFVVSIVSDDEATREVMLGANGVVASAAPGTVIVDSSTNTPAMAREVADAARARGLAHLDAPVSGSVPQSRNRELVFMVGGDAATLEKAKPLLEAMGRMTVHCGASGAGATIKLINNMLSGAMNAAIGEAISVATAAGVDTEAAQKVLAEGAAACRLMKTKIPKMLGGDFSPQFQLGLMEKDLRYFLALAQQVDRPVPITSIVRSQFQAARRAGLGGLDVSAIFLQASGEAARGGGRSG